MKHIAFYGMRGTELSARPSCIVFMAIRTILGAIRTTTGYAHYSRPDSNALLSNRKGCFSPW